MSSTFCIPLVIEAVQCLPLYFWPFSLSMLPKFFLLFSILLGWGYMVTLTKVLTVYCIWITPSIILPYTPYPIPEIFSTGLIFLLSYIWIQYLHHIHPPISSPHTISLLLVPNPRLDWINNHYFMRWLSDIRISHVTFQVSGFQHLWTANSLLRKSFPMSRSHRISSFICIPLLSDPPCVQDSNFVLSIHKIFRWPRNIKIPLLTENMVSALQ
jgi:hypothetical protein